MSMSSEDLTSGIGFSLSIKEQQIPHLSTFAAKESLSHGRVHGLWKQNEGNAVYVSQNCLLSDNITVSAGKSFPVNNMALSGKSAILIK